MKVRLKTIINPDKFCDGKSQGINGTHILVHIYLGLIDTIKQFGLY